MSSDFPPTPSQNKPLGGLQSVAAVVELAQSVAVQGLIPQNQRAIFQPLLKSLVSFARTQHEINRRIWSALSGYPLPHAATHKGGSDSIAGKLDPTQITADAEANVGTPQYGFAPIDHAHPITTGTPSGLGDANAEGSSADFVRQDHVHKRDVNVKEAGTITGTRNAINLVDTDTILLTTTDDSGNDKVDIQADLTTVWKDLRFPAQGIDPVGLAAPPSTSSSTGLLEFSGTLDNTIAGVAEMPPGWVPESTIKPHLHMIVPASNPGTNSRWVFEYNRANEDGNHEAAYGSYSALTTITVANPENTVLNAKIALGDLTMTGYTEGAIIMWRVTRLASSDAADDDTGVWAMASFDIDLQSDSRGPVVT